MIIMGIDPGTATTGVGIIQENNGKSTFVSHYSIRTPVDMEMANRLLMLRRELRKKIKEFKPDLVVVERLFFNINVKTAMTVSQAKGVILMTIAECGVPLKEYTALTAKLTLSGYGRATKDEVRTAVKKQIKLPKMKKTEDDAVDAIAIALCHVFKNGGQNAPVPSKKTRSASKKTKK